MDKPTKNIAWPIWFATAGLLLIAAGRLLRISLTAKELHVDEVWSVWQLLGTNTTYTLDTNWPPLYYMVLDGWQQVAGRYPVVLRSLSVFFFLLGAAFVYRLLRRAQGAAAGLLGMMVYSALALGIFLTTEIRGNALVFSLLPLALWLTMRYFTRPNWRRALPLAVTMAAMFYTAYTAFGAFILLGLFSLLVYRLAVVQWWRPGIIAGILAIPGIMNISSLAVGRVAATNTIELPPLLPAISGYFERVAGYSFLPWVGLFVIATILMVIARPRTPVFYGLVGWLFAPLLFYLLNPILGFFSATYGWFIAPGFLLWIGWGLSYLPRPGQFAAIGVALLVMFAPVPYDNYQAAGAPLGRSFEWLAQHVEWGDVVIIDPMWKDAYCGYRNCINASEWDYLIDLYFPQGLQIVSEPGDYRRIWYLKWDGEGWHDAELAQRIETGRIAGEFVGPPEALFRLYEGPPDWEGVLFENGLRFHGVDVVGESPRPLVRREGDTIRLRLWWSVDMPVGLDYSFSLQVSRNGQLAMQSDGGPQLIDPNLPDATSQWVPGQYYIEERELVVPLQMSSGRYPIWLAVYQWWDGERIAAPGMNDNKLLPILDLYMKAW
ncbi:MAG: glycosyltransferase family 39 protein [Anaerolineaceae bacterium]|nr:glycosyltransferase family 39 protein [Anaerolineaceae bacterium]